MTRRLNLKPLAMLAVAGATLVACGGGSSGSAPVPANPDLTVIGLDIKFDKTEYTVAAGDVEVAYISEGQQVHNLIIQDANKAKVGKTLKVGPGASVGGTYALAAGTYAMFCDIPGHKQSMNAVLIVT